MSMTPVELRHVSFGRRLLGYAPAAVDRALVETVDGFEQVWRERGELADRVEHLEGELVRYRELEALLRATLVSAEGASHEMKAQAKREAELIVGEAHAEARSIMHAARAEHERLGAEARRIRTLLRGALETVEEAPPAALEEGWPEAGRAEQREAA